MDLNHGSAGSLTIILDTRSTQDMATGERMLGRLEKTAPANCMIAEVDDLALFARTVQKFLDVPAMQRSCSNLLKKLFVVAWQLTEEFAKYVIDSCMEIFSIGLE